MRKRGRRDRWTRPLFAITDPAVSEATSTNVIDTKAGALVTLTGPANSQTLADPTNSDAGRWFTFLNNDTSTDSIDVDGYTIEPGEGMNFIWDGTAWLPVGDGDTGGGGSPTTASGYIYITDITPQSSGVVSDKTYQDTGNTVLQTCKSSTADITVSIKSSYPEVTVGSTPASLGRAVDESHYTGDVDITIAGSGNLVATVTTPDNETGPHDTVSITLDLPPELLTLSFTGSYPGSQTELKEDDTVQITGTTDVDCTGIRVIDYEAGKSYTTTFAATTSFTVSIPIADRGDVATLRPARVQAKNAVGAYGSTRDTNELGGTTELTDLVKCNNLYPTVTFDTINYPASQSALKNSETATVDMTTSDLDMITYSSPTAELSITNPTLDEATKTVQRISGSYNVSTNNLQAIANRAANDATTTNATVVAIANVAATINVTEPASRLKSGGNDGTSAQDYTITLTSNQQLYSAPSLSEDTGGGTFLGSWAGGPSVWTRSLQVHDDDTPGTYTWQSLSATNRAGIITTVITGDDTYVIGGFVARTISLQAFQTNSDDVNVKVTDFSKLTIASWSFYSGALTKQPIGSSPPLVPSNWTITASGTKPFQIIMLDTARAVASSQETYFVDVEETA